MVTTAAWTACWVGRIAQCSLPARPPRQGPALGEPSEPQTVPGDAEKGRPLVFLELDRPDGRDAPVLLRDHGLLAVTSGHQEHQEFMRLVRHFKRGSEPRGQLLKLGYEFTPRFWNKYPALNYSGGFQSGKRLRELISICHTPRALSRGRQLRG